MSLSFGVLSSEHIDFAFTKCRTVILVLKKNRVILTKVKKIKCQITEVILALFKADEPSLYVLFINRSVSD